MSCQTDNTYSPEIVLNAIRAYAVALAEMDDCPSEETRATRDEYWSALITLGIGTHEGAFTRELSENEIRTWRKARRGARSSLRTKPTFLTNKKPR